MCHMVMLGKIKSKPNLRMSSFSLFKKIFLSLSCHIFYYYNFRINFYRSFQLPVITKCILQHVNFVIKSCCKNEFIHLLFPVLSF